MSDVFEARIVSVEKCSVQVDVLSQPSGPLDLCTSRSFALLLLSDAVRRSIDFIPWSDPERPRKAAALYERHERAPLVRALAHEDLRDPGSMKEHVGLYIESCTLLERRNAMPEPELFAIEEAICAEVGGALLSEERARWGPMRWARCHSYRLAIVVTHPRLAEHLEPGMEFPTTAGDVVLE